MAMVRKAPYRVGDVAKLWPTDETNEWLQLIDPSGQEIWYRRPGHAAVRIKLLEPGEWTFRWAHDDKGTFSVLREDRETVTREPTPKVSRRWPAPSEQ